MLIAKDNVQNLDRADARRAKIKQRTAYVCMAGVIVAHFTLAMNTQGAEDSEPEVEWFHNSEKLFICIDENCVEVPVEHLCAAGIRT